MSSSTCVADFHVNYNEALQCSTVQFFIVLYFVGHNTAKIITEPNAAQYSTTT